MQEQKFMEESLEDDINYQKTTRKEIVSPIIFIIFTITTMTLIAKYLN